MFHMNKCIANFANNANSQPSNISGYRPNISAFDDLGFVDYPNSRVPPNNGNRSRLPGSTGPFSDVSHPISSERSHITGSRGHVLPSYQPQQQPQPTQVLNYTHIYIYM